MTEEVKYKGLGGWLILVGLGIIISPIKMGAFIFPIYSEMFTNGSWEALTTPGTEVYDPFWAPILIGEILINVGLIIASVFMIFLFFTKKKAFPKYYIGLMIFSLAFILADAMSIKIVLPNEPAFDPETMNELFRQLTAVLIWVPYMFISKRVKATFIN